MALIEATNLRVNIGAQPVLQGLDLAIKPGTQVGLIGPNGSGKTTLLRAIGGLLPYSGSLAFQGRQVRDWRPRPMARRLAFVRQSTPISFDFTVREIVLLGRSPHKSFLERDTRTDHSMVERALERVDLAGFAGRSIHSLSGGERRRAFLAQALVQEADLLMLDEPTTHLDVHHQFRFLHLVRGIVETGRTTIVVFHDIELAARFSDILLVLRDGKVAASGKPSEILTPKLMAAVFRMKCRVAPTSQICYIEPLR